MTIKVKQLDLQLGDILENIADGITVQDKSGRLIYVNEAALSACGVKDTNEMLNKDLTKLYKETLSNIIIKDENGNSYDLEDLPGRRALKGEENPSATIQYVNKKTGQIYWSTIKAKAIKDKNGEIVCAVNIVTDMTDRKHLEDALKFKAEASKALSSSLNYYKTLQTVADLAVPRFSDWCLIDIIKKKRVNIVAIKHDNDEKVEWAYKLRKDYPPDLKNTKIGIGKVLKTKQPYILNNIKDVDIKKGAKNKRHYDLLRKVGFTSLMMVPIIVQREVFGVITFINAKSKRNFTKDDQNLAKQLSYRTALAIENAVLYEEVITERQRLDHLLSNVPGVVWEAWGEPDDGKQRINYVSKHVEDMLGYSIDEWLDTPNFWLEIVHPDDKKSAAEEAAEIFQSGKSGISRFRWIKKNGEKLWVEAQSQVIKNKKGKPIGMRGVTMDITERMEIEKRKDDFISMASHELKTPLTSLNLYMHILKNNNLEDNYKNPQHFFEKMDKQIKKLDRLVVELLNVSKMQTGKLELSKSEFSLSELIEDDIDETKPFIGDRKIKLKGDASVKVYADKERIHQVMTNLLSNAIKFSPKDDEIIVSLEPNGKYIVVGVEDHGFGIEKQHQEKVFERFYRVLEKEDKTFPGLGMGLFISRQIIERHGGEIWIESEKGKGSKFYFKLPYN